uniref:Uncharacterized protein n=1 Tax=Kuenenia stuttgartiensis TaxID=174633 RepID=Q1PXY7_KUEST|nr:unknown protein [Candidatus Kuenenia stuttgartiensis]
MKNRRIMLFHSCDSLSVAMQKISPTAVRHNSLSVISLHTSIRQCVLFGKMFNGETRKLNTKF